MEIESGDMIMPQIGNGHKSDIVLQFSRVTYIIKQNKSVVKNILNETCGLFKSGRLSAILGPSGAGKTSMLNVLSGFKAVGVSGFIGLNGIERNIQNFRKISSYIPQDFPMLDLLTVFETIKVSADLKLSKTTCKEKIQIINNILEVLNMDKCSTTLVKNLSGGERKRLSIAVELVTNPPVMFFDEPTSGLDSVSSLQVINYLRHLARDGRILVCVVHQPSSRLMSLFDDIMVMSKGEVLYCGSQEGMINYFQEEGFICPKHYNPADFVLEVGSEEHGNNITALVTKNKTYHRLKKCVEEPHNIDEKCQFLTSHTTIKVQHEVCTVRPKVQASLLMQFSVLMQRTVRAMSRNMISVQLRVIMHALVAILLGIVFYDIGNDAAKILTNTSCIFFSVLFVFFGNAMPSILLCPQDTAVFLREYLNGWYSMTAYYLSKIVSDLPLQFLCPTIFMSIAYVMTGQPEDLGRFAMCCGIALLTAVLGHFFGLVIGSTFDLQMGVFLVPSICIPIMLFSGFFIRIHELASFLRPLTVVSFFRYTIEGFVQSIYGYNRTNLECHQDFCYFKSADKFLKDMGMAGDRYGTDIFALLLSVALLMLLFLLSLVLRIRKAQ